MSLNQINPMFIPHATRHESMFIGRVTSAHRTMCQYGDPLLQAQALSLIPEQRIRSVAKQKFDAQNEPNESQQQQSSSGHHDLDHFVMRELLHWFKSEFFQWVNSPPCAHCNASNNSTKAIGRSGPQTPGEIQGLASTVEVYGCENCGQTTRFPRYNHASALLESRCGRCGEWAQCFTLMCISMGFRARFVNDWTDHVWTEVFIERRWQHADSCEASLDASLMYESGWGKKLNMIVAVGFDEVVDVTRRYTRQWQTEEFQSRRRSSLGISESFIEQCIANMNYQLQFVMTPQQLQELKFRQEQEQEELRATMVTETTVAMKEEELRGRQSGSKQWVESRGEGGASCNKEKRAMCATPPVGIDMQLLDAWSRDSLKHDLIRSGGGDDEKLSFVGSAARIQDHSSQQSSATTIVQLTPNRTSQTGAVWYVQKQELSSSSSSGMLYVSFSFRASRGGADGLALVLQNDSVTAIGEGGCGIGYQGIRHSVAIEFDTYCTYDRCNDPDGNHISVQTRYSEPNSAHHHHSVRCVQNLESDYGIVLNNGQVHHVRFVYDHASKKMHLSINGLWIVRDVALDLVKVFGSDNKFWIGFTAGTGGLCQAHDILSFNVLSSQSSSPVSSNKNTTTSSSSSSSEYVQYSVGNVAGIKKKLIEFNGSSSATVALSKSECNVLAVRVMKDLETTATAAVSSSFVYNDEVDRCIFKILGTWPLAKHFPVLDLLRLCISKYPKEIGAYYRVKGSFFANLLSRKEQQQPAANRMIVYRLLCNALASNDVSCQLIAPELSVIFERVIQENSPWVVKESDKAPVREPFIAFVHNLILMYSHGRGATTETAATLDEESLVQLLNALVMLLRQELAQEAAEDRNVHLVLKSMLHALRIQQQSQEEIEEGLVAGLLLSMDVGEVLNSVSSNEKLSQTTRQCARQLSQIISG